MASVLGVWGKHRLVFQCREKGGLPSGTGYAAAVLDPDSRPSLTSVNGASHAGQQLELGVSLRSMDNGICRFTAVPISDVGVYNILFVAHVGWCPVCYFSPTYSLPSSSLCLLAYHLPLCQSVCLYSFAEKQLRSLPLAFLYLSLA